MRPDYKGTVYPYLLNAIDFSDYDANPETEQEKLQELFNEFNRVAVYKFNLQKFGNYQDMFADWLQGLPGMFNIPFSNYDILQLAEKWRSLPENATEKQEDKILNNYYNFMSANVFKLFRKYKITMNYNC